MSIDVREVFAAWRRKHARRAWKPSTVEGGRGDEAHFGGSPSMAPGEPWPRCQGCNRWMQFFLQIPLASFPAGASRGDGTLQLFYCSQDDGRCETWRPFSGTHVVRLLHGPASPVAHPLGLAPFPTRTINQWTELIDHPHAEEHASLGLVYDYDFPNKRVSVSCDELGISLRDLDLESDVAETISAPATGDKLGGWPAWIQRAEYPACPTCARRMELVLQLDSEDNVPHMFGDAGLGHITQCPDHPRKLAFGWACS
jgi:uncharacterized protein YwqG